MEAEIINSAEAGSLDRIRQVLRDMREEEGVNEVLPVLSRELEGRGVALYQCGVNLVSEKAAGSAQVRTYNLNKGRWESCTSRSVEILHKIWWKGEVAYRRDLEAEDMYQEAARLRKVFGRPIRCVVDLPFSHGTLALNSTRADAFSSEVIVWLQEVAQLLGSAFQKADDLRRFERSREAYRVIAELVSDDIYSFETAPVAPAEGRAVDWVPLADSSVTGFSREEISARGGWGGLVVAVDAATLRRHIETVLAGKPSECEYRVLDREWKERWVRDYARSFPQEGGCGRVRVYGAVRDITRRKETEASLRSLSRWALEAEESERRRISRELHDGVNPVLLTASLTLHGALTDLRGRGVADLGGLEEGMDLVKEAVQEIRRLSHNLRPGVLDDLGFRAAVTGLVRDFRRMTGIEATLDCSAEVEEATAGLEDNLYRMLQEALCNVGKHAEATAVRVEVRQDGDALVARVADNGRGFDYGAELREGSGIGLRNLRERTLLADGEMTCRRLEPRGTEVSFRLPLRGQDYGTCDFGTTDRRPSAAVAGH